jgi:hypothetical protein
MKAKFNTLCQPFPAKPQAPMQQGFQKTGFRNLFPEKPVNNAGPVTFSAGIAERFVSYIRLALLSFRKPRWGLVI